MPPSISILVDYAHEPESMKQLLQTASSWRTKEIFDKIVHVISCDGVGRDDWKKPIMGYLSYQHADFSVVTTDNYTENDNPEDILHSLSQNFPEDTNLELANKKYTKIVDRRKAFETALDWALSVGKESKERLKILIISTGVGSEFGLTQPKTKLDWDERNEWQQVFKQKVSQT